MKTNECNTLKLIGLVDYRLDNFHADVYLEAIRGPLAECGFTIAGATAIEREPSEVWAVKNRVRYFDTVASLDETVDYFMVLAPSNPECHLQLCEQVFPCGKTTYVDKTFAPDLATAEKIYALADHHEVDVQTSSALRYTNVQAFLQTCESPIRHLAVWGGGTSFDEYAIHPIELAISCMGPDALQLTTLGDADHQKYVLCYDAGRTVTIDFNAREHVPFAAAITTDLSTEFITVDDSHLFVDTASAILDFFQAGESQIARKESLLIRRILDCISSAESQETFVTLQSDKDESVPKQKLNTRKPAVHSGT